MAGITKRRNADGSSSWDALVRIVGYPPICKSFRTKLGAELWAARTEPLRKGGGWAITGKALTFSCTSAAPSC